MNQRSSQSAPMRYELRFRSLFQQGRGYAFPCDVDGHVDIDALNGAARTNYFYVRAMVGRELAAPVVQAGVGH